MGGTIPDELGYCFPELNSFKFSFNQVAPSAIAMWGRWLFALALDQMQGSHHDGLQAVNLPGGKLVWQAFCCSFVLQRCNRLNCHKCQAVGC